MPDISLSTANGVATLTLAAPDRLNAITPAMADEITEACERITEDSSCAALVLQGAGPSFCSGADLSSLSTVAGDPLEDENFAAIDRIYSAFLSVERLDVLTVAALRGAAVGAGLNLALATDVRIVADDVRLMSGFVRKGLHPGGGHFDLLVRHATAQAAAAIAIAGETVDGPRAVALGLAWASLPAADVETAAADMASRVADRSPVVRAAKRSLRAAAAPQDARQTAVQIERVQQLRTMRRLGADIARRPD